MAKKLTEKTLVNKLNGMSREELTKIIVNFYRTNRAVESDFADACAGDSGRWYGDLALYFAECATDFTMSYGDIDGEFYDALGDAYHDAVVIASSDEQLYQLWKDRLAAIFHAFSGFGWGMDDFISEEYHALPWTWEE